MTGIAKFNADGFFNPAPSPPWRGRPVAKDVYPYLNGTMPVPLCISHAVERRQGGATVTMVSDRPVARECVDCSAELTMVSDGGERGR